MAPLPHVLQLNWAHLEEPDLGSSDCERKRGIFFFLALLRDFSGAVHIAVAERAALCLSSCANMEEFVKRHAEGFIVFPPFCNLRITQQMRNRSNSDHAAGDFQGGVNLVVAGDLPMRWEPQLAPKASSNTLPKILQQCPE